MLDLRRLVSSVQTDYSNEVVCERDKTWSERYKTHYKPPTLLNASSGFLCSCFRVDHGQGGKVGKARWMSLALICYPAVQYKDQLDLINACQALTRWPPWQGLHLLSRSLRFEVQAR